MKKLSILTILIVNFVLLSSVSSQQQTCAPYQTWDTPRTLTSSHCSIYNPASCCDPGVSKRALNWALEDDGCGIVGGPCLQDLIALACAINCKPDLPTFPQVNLYGISNRPVICASFANQVFNDCKMFAWCGINQLATSTCTFEEVITNSKTGTASGAIPVDAYDTCTLVGNLTPAEFASTILEVVMGNSTDCFTPAHVPYSAANSIMINFVPFIVVSTVALLALFRL